MCDDKLKSIMGGKSKVSMFNMNSHITHHLIEKLDRSAYTHEGAEDDDDGEV
jgi:chromatin remodeling complex protein RSC6